jgi:hypothetical protein
MMPLDTTTSVGPFEVLGGRATKRWSKKGIDSGIERSIICCFRTNIRDLG